MVSKIYRQGAFETFYDMPLRINWILTEMCNYRCSYCFFKNKKTETNKFSTLTQIKKAIKHISSLNRPSYDITLSGGEPTIHPCFFDIIHLVSETLKERLNKILIITNGSNNNGLYNRIADISSDVNIKMQVSLHSEFVKMEHIIEMVETLSNKVFLRFALMYNPEKQKIVEEEFKILMDLRKKYPFTVDVVMLRPTAEDERGKIPYDIRYQDVHFLWQRNAHEDFLLLSKNAPPISYEDEYRYNIFYDVADEGGRKIVCGYENRLNNFKKMFCLSGSHLLRIEADGRTRGMVCWGGGQKYNIFQENPYLHEDFIQVVECPANSCGCRSNMHIPKFFSKDEAEAFANICRDKQKRLFNK